SNINNNNFNDHNRPSDYVNHAKKHAVGDEISGPIPNYIQTLITAVQRDDYNFLKNNLIQLANINERVLNGDTLLHLAVKKRNYVIVKILLENGANVCSLNVHGLSPLEIYPSEIPAKIGNFKIQQ